MKRFIAYILLCASVILATLVGSVPSILSINTSADYSSGQYFIYKITEKEGSSKNEGDILSGEAIKTISEIFKERLDDINVSSYQLEVEGNDTIRVSLKAENVVNFAISSFLNVDANYQVMNFDGNAILESEDFFEAGKAEINYDNNYPTIVINLSKPELFKTTIYENCNGSKNDEENALKEILKNNKTTTMETTSSEESTPDNQHIYIVNNWEPSYSIDKIINDTNNADTKELLSYIGKIDASKPENVYNDYDEEDKDKVCEELIYTNFLGLAGDDLNLANRLALIYCAKFNASELDYNVTLINKDYINNARNNSPALVENFIYRTSGYGAFNSIVLSSCLISILIAGVAVAVFLFLNHGISALSTVSITPAIILLTTCFFNLFGAEFNIGSVIGIVLLAIISLFSSLPYLKTIKEECYNGRTLKKANEEASKKTIFMQIDISAIALIFGLIAYLIPNSYMVSIGVYLVVGALLNLILNGALLRLMMFYLTNSNYASHNLKIAKIEEKLIPDLSRDEKPTYFEQFKKEIKKPIKTKTLGFIALGLFAASVIGLTIFSVVNKNIYNVNNDNPVTTRVYLEFDYDEDSTIKDSAALEEKLFQYLFTYENNSTTDKRVGHEKILAYTYSYKENYSSTQETLVKSYFIIDMDNIYDDDTRVSAYVDRFNKLEGVVLEDAIRYLISDYHSTTDLLDVSVKSVTNVSNDSNNIYCLVWAAIASGCALVYFSFRFGVARAVSSVAITFGSMVVTTGIFSLIRGPFNSVTTFGSLVIGIVGYLIFDYIFSKEKTFVKENKNKLTNIQSRKEATTYITNLVYGDLLFIIALIGIIIASTVLNKSFQPYFALYIILGLIFVYWYSRYALKEIVYNLNIFFAGVESSIKEKINANRSKHQKKEDVGGDGPEEAIFIGIND